MGQTLQAEVICGPELNDDGSITSIVRAGDQVFRFTHHGQFITHPTPGKDEAQREALAAAHLALHDYLADNPDALRRLVDLRRRAGSHVSVP